MAAETLAERTGLTAQGTSQTTAYPLAKNTAHEFTTVPEGSGAKLPVPSLPCAVVIHNRGANPLVVYPTLGGSINEGPMNNPVSLPVGEWFSFYAESVSNYYQHATPLPAPAAGIEEAPDDGQLYGRCNKTWVVIPAALIRK